MKKWWVVGCGLCVVGLLLVMAAPVLAAVVWEWQAGDACIWIDEYDDETCNENGIVVPPGDSMEGGILVVRQTNYLPPVSSESIYLTTTCTNLIFTIHDSVDIEVIAFAEFPKIIDFSTETAQIYIYNQVEEICIISSITIGEPDPTPTPDPTGVDLLGDFTTTNVFTTASDLVTALGSVIAVIGGILLGWRVLGWLIRRFTA